MTEPRLFVALDTTAADASRIIAATFDLVEGYKIGPVMMFDIAWRGALAEARIRSGFNIKIMLDLKLADTIDTSRRVIDLCAELFINYLTCTPGRGPTLQTIANQPYVERPHLLGVLGLTDRSEPYSVASSVFGAAFAAFNDAYDGVVCPPSYVSWLRDLKEYKKPIFCPGIRLPGETQDNHLASFRPGDALMAGATSIIVGRPITQAADPRSAVETILADMNRGKPDANQSG